MSSDTDSEPGEQVAGETDNGSGNSLYEDPDIWKDQEDEDLSTLGATATCVKSFSMTRESSRIVRTDNGKSQIVDTPRPSSREVRPYSRLDVGITPVEVKAGQSVQYNVIQHIHMQQFGDVTIEGARNLNIGGTQNITRETGQPQEEDEKSLTMAQKIRVRTESRINSWTKSMVKTQGLTKVLALLKDGVTCVTIKGSPGEGKTTAAYMALEELHTEGRQVFQVISPRECAEIMSTYSRPIIMLDDIFGDLEFDEAEWRKWKSVLKEVLAVKEHRSHETVTKSKGATVIIVGRDYILKSASRHMGRLANFVRKKQYVVNMSAVQSIHEKLDIWNAIVTDSGISLNENRILQLCKLRGQHGFPHVCRLFATMHKENADISPESFFNKPFEFLGNTVETFMDNELKLTLFEDIIRGGGKVSVRELGHGRHVRKIIQTAEDLVGTYLRKQEDYFMFDHPSIYDCVAYHLCKLYPLFVIENCDIVFIHQRLRLQHVGPLRYSVDSPSNESDLVIHIPRSYIKDLAKRFAAEIRMENLYHVLSHHACADESFAQELMSHITMPLKSNDTFLSLITSSKSHHLLRCIHTEAGRNLSVTEIQTVLFGICKYAATDALSYLTEIADCIDINDESGDNGKTPLMVAAETGDSKFVGVIMSLKPDLKLKDREDKCVFHYLCENGHTLAVKQVITQTEDIDVEDKWGWTPLYYACRSNQLAVIKLLLEKGAKVDGKALELACITGNLDTVKLLFEKGASIDMASNTGHIPIVTAGLSGSTDIIGFLMDRGASVNADERSNSLLHRVCGWNKPHTAEYLLHHGAEIDKMDCDGYTPLHKAVEADSTNCVKVLLKAGVDVNIQNHVGETALHKASENALLWCMGVLLQAQSNVNLQSQNGSSPLHKAAWTGSVECVQMLLEAGSDVNIQDRDGYTALHTAAGRGYVNCVTMLLKAGCDVNACSKDGHTALYVAAESKATDCISVLLHAGANVNIKCKQGKSPLRAATDGYKPLTAAYQSRLKECVRLLLKAGADVNTQDKYGYTPLYRAVENGCRDVVNILLHAGADVNVEDKYVSTSLYVAVAKRFDEILNDLLNFAADVNKKGFQRFIPLHKAVENRSEDFVVLLLKAGTNVNIQNKEGYTALHNAIITKYYDCVDMLLKKGADVNIASDNGYTALHGAAEQKAEECLSTLLRAGANVNAKMKDGNTALHNAARNGSHQCVDMLLKAGADVNSKCNDGRTALQRTTLRGSVKCGAVLLKAGAHVNALDDDGNTALHGAAFSGSRECVEMLLRAGAHVCVQNTNGLTALHDAASQDSEQCVDLLVKAGADVNMKCKRGNIALWNAALHRKPQCFDILLKLGTDVNSVNENGSTALHKYATTGTIECVNMLLKAGANVRGQNKEGNTELHYAVRSGSKECVEVFLKYGIDVNVQNEDGNTALHDAVCWKGSSECLDILLKAGASVNLNNKKGYVALHVAAEKSLRECADMLLKSGADVMITDNSGETPLHKAVLGRAMFWRFDPADVSSVCTLLLTSNTDCVNAQDNDGNTPLHLLCPADEDNLYKARARRIGLKPSYNHHFHMSLMELLLDRGADANILNNKGVPALCLGCSERR